MQISYYGMNIIDMQMNIFHPQNYKNYLHFYFSIKWTIKNYYISYFLKKKIKLEIQIFFFCLFPYILNSFYIWRIDVLNFLYFRKVKGKVVQNNPTVHAFDQITRRLQGWR